MTDKVTWQCPQTTTFLKRKESRTVSNRGPSAYQPNALPLGQTGSPWALGYFQSYQYPNLSEGRWPRPLMDSCAEIKSVEEGAGKRCSECDSEHRFPAPPPNSAELVTPLKGHSLSPRSCPPTRSAPSERFGIRLWKQPSAQAHSSGAVWESRWPSWAVRPNEPSGFRGRKDILNHALALVTACP